MDGEYPVLAEFATGLMSPRGLAWDGDQTLFVADEVHGMMATSGEGT